MSTQDFQDAPASTTCRLVSFHSAQIVESKPPKLVVKGTAPCLNMHVSLQPRIYIQCPDYWGIEVVGCLQGPFCLTAIKEFTETIVLDGIIGSEGIEVIGANDKEQIEVSGGCDGDLHCDVAV